MEKAVEEKLGKKNIYANVLSTNKKMLGLFEKLNFTLTKEDFESYYAELSLEAGMTVLKREAIV